METINKRVLNYVLRKKEETGKYPTARETAKDLEIGKTTAQKYISLLKEKGIIETKKEKPGEDQVYDFILEYERKNGVYPTEKVIAESIEKARSTIREHILRMLRSGRIENKGNVYTISGENYKKSIKSMRDEARLTDGIRMKDIEKIRNRIREGDRIYLEDGCRNDISHGEFIKPVYARVKSVHRVVVRMDNGAYCTLQQIVAGERRKQKTGSKSKTWIAVRWSNQKDAILKGES